MSLALKNPVILAPQDLAPQDPAPQDPAPQDLAPQDPAPQDPAPQDPAPQAERRSHRRVSVNLLGRYMLPDRREFPCQVTNMSPGGMALIAPVNGEVGERVIAYVDHIGRLEGVIARQFANGFAMTITATMRKRDKLAARLTWLAKPHILGLPQDRRHRRVTPRNPMARLLLPNGVGAAVRVIDISQSGVALKTEHRLECGTPVSIGRTQGRVVRHLEEGFAIEFLRLQHPDFLEENVTGG